MRLIDFFAGRCFPLLWRWPVKESKVSIVYTWTEKLDELNSKVKLNLCRFLRQSVIVMSGRPCSSGYLLSKFARMLPRAIGDPWQWSKCSYSICQRVQNNGISLTILFPEIFKLFPGLKYDGNEKWSWYCSGTFDAIKFLFPFPRCHKQSSFLIMKSSQAFLL